MSQVTRIARAEGNVGSALLWYEIQKLATETGQSAKELFLETNAMLDRYWHLAKALPGGKLDIDPALRAMAQDEGLDYDELLKEVKRLLHLRRRRERRRRT